MKAKFERLKKYIGAMITATVFFVAVFMVSVLLFLWFLCCCFYGFYVTVFM